MLNLHPKNDRELAQWVIAWWKLYMGDDYLAHDYETEDDAYAAAEHIVIGHATEHHGAAEVERLLQGVAGTADLVASLATEMTSLYEAHISAPYPGAAKERDEFFEPTPEMLDIAARRGPLGLTADEAHALGGDRLRLVEDGVLSVDEARDMLYRQSMAASDTPAIT